MLVLNTTLGIIGNGKNIQDGVKKTQTYRVASKKSKRKNPELSVGLSFAILLLQYTIANRRAHKKYPN